MMSVINHKLYQNDIDYIANLDLPWEKLKNKNVLISGAGGLIGSCIVDVLMHKKELNCQCYALGRNLKKAKKRFAYCWDNTFFHFIQCDVNKSINVEEINRIDYILHFASNTHPIAYAMDPIGTIMTNIIGTQNMLDLAVEFRTERVVFASSNEIYGENRGDVEKFDEEYCGYIDCNSMRAGYPESKRCGESLCQAYIKQKAIDVVIPRLTRTYGPTMLMTDTKAIAQFIQNGINGENIVLKSNGEQYFSYLYVADAVAGIFYVMLLGKNGEAYNIADERSDIRLRDLARLIAYENETEVVFEIPDKVEASGYSKATKARLSSEKINQLGWKARYDINSGVGRTIEVLKDIYKSYD